MFVVSTGSMITVLMGTEVSKVSIGRDTASGPGVGVAFGAAVAVGVAVAVAVGVTVAVAVGVGGAIGQLMHCTLVMRQVSCAPQPGVFQ